MCFPLSLQRLFEIILTPITFGGLPSVHTETYVNVFISIVRYFCLKSWIYQQIIITILQDQISYVSKRRY
jgi:hypothetical protein